MSGLSIATSTECINSCLCSRACLFMTCEDIELYAFNRFESVLSAVEEVIRCRGCAAGARCTGGYNATQGPCHIAATVRYDDTTSRHPDSVQINQCSNDDDQQILVVILVFMVACLVVAVVWFYKLQHTTRTGASVTPVDYMPRADGPPTPPTPTDDGAGAGGDEAEQEAEDAPGADTTSTPLHAERDGTRTRIVAKV